MSDTSSTFDKCAQTPTAWWDDFKLACVFLSRIPLQLKTPLPDQALNRSVRCFPVVGTLLGVLGAGVMWVGNWFGLPVLLCAMLGILTITILSGALHEDGLADVVDGFWGGQTRDDKLRIMRDSRIGAYGVLALIFSIGLRTLALGAIDDVQTMGLVLISVATLSRFAPVYMLVRLDPARNNGVASGLKELEPLIINQGALIALLIPICLLPLGSALLALLFAFIALEGSARLVRRHIGGQTGDTCGAAQQVTEIAALIYLAGLL